MDWQQRKLHCMPHSTLDNTMAQVDAVTALMESARGTNPGHLDEPQLTTLLETLLTRRTVHARALAAFLAAYGSLRDIQYVMLRGVAALCATRQEDRSQAHAPPEKQGGMAADAMPRDGGTDAVLAEDDVARNVYDALMCVYHGAMEASEASNDDGAAKEAGEPSSSTAATPATPSYKVVHALYTVR